MNKLNTSKLSLTVHSIETSKFNKKKKKKKRIYKIFVERRSIKKHSDEGNESNIAIYPWKVPHLKIISLQKIKYAHTKFNEKKNPFPIIQ